MAKTSFLSVCIDDDNQIIVPFRRRYLKHAVYLMDEWPLDDGDDALLSILAYPAVWTTECALWERDFAGLDSRSAIGQIAQARQECYENAKRQVKRALTRCTYTMDCNPSPKIAKDGFEFRLVDHMGRVNATKFVDKADWKQIVKACELDEWHSGARELILDLYTDSIVRKLTTAILKRDYGRTLLDEYKEWKASCGGDGSNSPNGQGVSALESIITPAKRRLLRCMV